MLEGLNSVEDLTEDMKIKGKIPLRVFGDMAMEDGEEKVDMIFKELQEIESEIQISES